MSRSLSNLRRLRAVVGGAGSQEWSVCICVQGWVGHRHQRRVVGSEERRSAEHKLSRTSGRDCPRIKIPDLIPLTSHTLPQEINIFSRAEWKAKASKVRPAHEHLLGQSPVPPALFPVQRYIAPQAVAWSRVRLEYKCLTHPGKPSSAHPPMRPLSLGTPGQ